MLLRNGSRGLVIFLCVMAAPVSAFAQQPKEIQVTATEFSFKPSKIQVPQGEVKKIKKNRLQIPESTGRTLNLQSRSSSFLQKRLRIIGQ